MDETRINTGESTSAIGNETGFVSDRYGMMFVADLDGTLLNDQRHFPKAILDSLRLIQARHGVTVIATGRSDNSFFQQMALLGLAGKGLKHLPVDFLVFSTGAGILDCRSGRLLRSRNLSPDHVTNLVSFLESERVDYMVHRPIPETVYFSYRRHGAGHPDFRCRLHRYRDFGTELPPDGLQTVGEATEVLVVVDAERADVLLAALRRRFTDVSIVRATSPLDGKSVWIELFEQGVSKSQAVAWLCQQHGISRQRVGAVGNDHNDADLLDWAGTSYLVANAPAVMHKHYTLVPSNNDGGVALAVSQWLTSLAPLKAQCC